jgi:hypothetical protein
LPAAFQKCRSCKMPPYAVMATRNNVLWYSKHTKKKFKHLKSSFNATSISMVDSSGASTPFSVMYMSGLLYLLVVHMITL